MTYRERFFVLLNTGVFADARFYDIYTVSPANKKALGLILNSTLTLFFIELMSRTYGGGGGPVDVKVYEVENLLIINPEFFKVNKKLDKFLKREIASIFQEIGFNPRLPIRDQEPNPLPDRKELDDIIFDILGLTQQERKEVYWAVCELVKNRLEKARSV
jgi:ribosomal protein S24E